MARAPHQYRIAVTGGALLWGRKEGLARVSDRATVGLDVERRVGPFLGFRLGGAYGATTVESEPAGTGVEVTDVNQFLVDLTVVVRLAVGSLRRIGAVPFGTLGVGAVVHDPRRSDLVTKSQSAASFGGGLDLELGGPVGGRLEWRRYVVDSEDLFDPTDRAGRSRTADRLFGSLYLRF